MLEASGSVSKRVSQKDLCGFVGRWGCIGATATQAGRTCSVARTMEATSIDLILEPLGWFQHHTWCVHNDQPGNPSLSSSLFFSPFPLSFPLSLSSCFILLGHLTQSFTLIMFHSLGPSNSVFHSHPCLFYWNSSPPLTRWLFILLLNVRQ